MRRAQTSVLARPWGGAVAGAALAYGTAIPAAAQSWRVTPEVQFESRLFFDDPQFRDQVDTFQGGLVLTGDARWTSQDRNQRIRLEPYLRLDSADDERTYFDMREATFSSRFGDWDVLVGFGQVFWGVAESRNVVDIINQFDTIEDFDQEEKLGQPLARLSYRTDVGTFEAYYLPFFRERQFPGGDGRLRGPVLVDNDRASYTRGGEEWAGDFALRYENTIDAFDVGVHAFYGTSREPLLRPAPDGKLRPRYQERSQVGVDVQYTEGPWLLKFEGIGVAQGGDRFFASVSGFEYTFFDIRQTGVDLGLIGEYLYDGRDTARVPRTLFEDDVFAGLRLTLNDPQDTELLAGAIVDPDNGAVIGSVEFQRRLGDNMLLEIEGRYFSGSGDFLLDGFDRDSFLLARLRYYF